MITAAFIGCPNSGKTTLFNKLTGSIQKVGNWPGVTVERKQGYIRGTEGERILVVDLPGIYSLSPYSPEEIVSRDFLIGTADSRPDVAINIVDASNLERAMYLLMQVSDIGIPMVVILNMTDLAAAAGKPIDSKKLSEVLGCEVVETVALRNHGVSKVADAVRRAYEGKRSPEVLRFPNDIEGTVAEIEEIVRPEVRDGLERFVAVKAIEGDPMILGSLEPSTVEKIGSVASALEKSQNDDGMEIVSSARYDLAHEIAEDCIDGKHPLRTSEKERSVTEKADDIILNRWLAIPIFVGIMFLMYFFSIQTVGTMATDYVNEKIVGEWAHDGMESFLTEAGVDGQLVGLICEGIINGAGSVMGFVPQILCLFLCLALLEEIGYMARVAYMLDRLFCRFGLSGQSVIPMVIGTGCGVPAIMGTRTINDDQTRTITAITTTMMPCSAKLPIITVVIAAFFHESALVATSMYFMGIFMILVSGIILKKIKDISGTPAPFMMELPVYHRPTSRNVATSVLERSWSFVKKAGTFILLATVMVWLLSSYSFSLEYVEDQGKSMLADIGNAITWIFLPNGFGNHWEMTVGTVTGLLAKENLLGTLAILVPGSSADEAGLITAGSLQGFCTSAEGMSFLIFNLLCAPCFAAIGAMKRELGTWKRTGFAVAFLCTMAYVASMVFYNVATALSGDIHVPGLVASFLCMAVIGYFLVAKDPVGTIRRKIREVSA